METLTEEADLDSLIGLINEDDIISNISEDKTQSKRDEELKICSKRDDEISDDAAYDLDSLIDLMNEKNNSGLNLPQSDKVQGIKEKRISDGKKHLQSVDIFASASASEDTTAPCSLENNESTVIHNGDTSSDEEEKEYLTESGQEIKKKIAIKSNYEDKIQRNKITWKSQRDLNSLSNQKQSDSFSGIRIVNPLVPFDVIQQRMQGRKLIKMSFIETFIKKGDIDGDWVTVGVVVRKVPPKTSKNGKLFSIWKLTDLHNTEKIVNFFLFGQVHKELWKTSVGTVIGILNASIMSARDNANETSITVDHPGKVMLMGTSKDFGHCKGKRKDGEKCTMIVNISQCEYCVYHIQSEYKKFSQRTEIQSSYSGRGLNLREKVLKGQNVFYAGQTFVPLGKSQKKSDTLKSKDKLTLSNLTLKRKATVVFNEEKAKSVKKLTEMYGDEISEVAEKNSEFINNKLTTPSAGSKHLLLHMLKNKPVKKEDNAHHINPKEFLKQRELQRNSMLPQKKCDAEILKSLMPELGKGLRPGQNVALDFSSSKLNTSVTHENFAKIRAIQKVKQSGPIKKQNPNAVKSKPEQKKIEAVLEKSFEEDSAKNATPEKTALLSQGTLGSIDLNSEKVQKILNRKSSHAYEVEMAEMEREAAYFARLEKKEMMEEKMSSTKEIVCDVISCKQCRYTAQHATERCKQESHPLKCHKALKRFYACKDCKTRTVCYTKFPTRSCRYCGGSNYERTGMIRVRSGPKLASEQLNICNEDRFLNSL